MVDVKMILTRWYPVTIVNGNIFPEFELIDSFEKRESLANG